MELPRHSLYLLIFKGLSFRGTEQIYINDQIRKPVSETFEIKVGIFYDPNLV
jgi:hypothetical protein